MREKINSIESLKKIIAKLKTKGKKIVLCHGVFDLLHVGHINHFQESKKYADILVVSVTSDSFVNKGPNRPAFDEQNRLKALASLQAIDYVVLSKFPTAVPIIKEIKPNFYSKGQDYKFYQDITGEIKNEINALKKVNGKMIYTKGEVFSSSNLINKFSEVHSTQHKDMIEKIKKKYSFKKIKKLIEKFKKLKVLVIGETIIDQYIFCEAIGKSGKEPVLALKDIKNEQYLGGAAAVCRHISAFCKKISLLSMVGEKKEYISDIKKGLPKNVNFKYIRKKNSPTIVKKRFLDNLNNNKVLGVYSINDDLLTNEDEKKFNKILKKLLLSHDLIITSDYGHGLISETSAQIISKYSKYLALNAQINASNIGYHSMRNYKNIDCVIINENEIKHELRDKNSNIVTLMKKLSKLQNINNLVVTRGMLGALLYNKNKNKIIKCEAFAKTVIDKVGAGDAMLAIIALFFKTGFTKELSLLIGSLAAAQSVETSGNKEAVNKTKILKALQHLLV
tara:strand:+ start:573 stop:2093 length:1521 start_codon:yes stop_codon:yes gene_type:complete